MNLADIFRQNKKLFDSKTSSKEQMYEAAGHAKGSPILFTQSKINTKNPMENEYVAGWISGTPSEFGYLLIKVHVPFGKDRHVIVAGSGKMEWAKPGHVFHVFHDQSRKDIGDAEVIAHATNAEEIKNFPRGTYSLYVFK